MLAFSRTNVLSWLFPPTRLEAEFPWSVQTAGKKYAAALLHFVAGSLAIPLLVLLPVFFLAFYPAILAQFLEPLRALTLLAHVGASAALPIIIYRVWQIWRGKLAADRRTIAVTGVAAVITGLLAAYLFAVVVHALYPVYPQVIRRTASMLSDANGQPNMTFVMGLSALSFIGGFGLQLRYIAASLRSEGKALSQVMALNFDKLKGSSWRATAFNTVWPVMLAYGIWQIIGEAIVFVLGSPHQPTVELAKSAVGGNFVLFALMAAVGAPLFEEVVFRGFLQNLIRSSLRRELTPLILVPQPTNGSLRWLRKLIVGLINCRRRTGAALAALMQQLLGGSRTELSAIVISSFMFAVLHLQFHPTTLVMLFVLGCIHAELYRRTGSLYCSILLHAANNGIEVLKLALGA